MTEAKRPNPSFFTLDISDRDRVAAVDAMIAEHVEDEDGNVLTWVGGSDYVLCRPAAKILLLGGSRDDVAAFLRGLAFVRGVKFTRAGDMVRSFSERRVVDLPGDARPIPGKQWNLDTVNARAAWDMVPGPIDDKPWRAVRIGHLDTGYTEHPVLGFDGNGRSASVRAEEGRNYFDGGGLPRDPLREFGTPGHGTRTMSVLNGYLADTFFGVAPNATVVPYRVTDFVVIDTLWNRNPLDQAIEHAVFHTGCRVLSISLGDPCFPPSRVGKAIDRAYLAGTIVVAAAGNVTSEVTFPGRYARTIAVGGVTQKEFPWSGGSRGARVDISAPAHDIYRATVKRPDGGLVYDYGPGGDGTSYATVHVSGAAVIWLAKHGNGLDHYREKWQIVEAFRWCLAHSARKPADWNGDLFGAGILDIAALLNEALPDPGELVREDDVAEDDIA